MAAKKVVKKYWTKADAEKIFKRDFADFIKECCTMPTDFAALRQCWNDWIDQNQRGMNPNVNPSSDWSQPDFVANPKVKKG